MEKLLLIGAFDDATKELYRELKKYVPTQLCSDHKEVVKSMLQMYRPDAVLLCLQEKCEKQCGVLELLAEDASEVPVLTLGTEQQQEGCFAFRQKSNFFSLILPQAVPRILEAVAEAAGETADSEKEGWEKRHLVLLVDDSPVLLRSMKHMLEERYRVSMAASGSQALEMIARETPDVILLDYEMPEYDGCRTLELIRAREDTKNTPVIFLTGHRDAEHVRRMMALDPAGYFVKPPRAEEILNTLEKLLKQQKADAIQGE